MGSIHLVVRRRWSDRYSLILSFRRPTVARYVLRSSSLPLCTVYGCCSFLSDGCLLLVPSVCRSFFVPVLLICILFQLLYRFNIFLPMHTLGMRGFPRRY